MNILIAKKNELKNQLKSDHNLKQLKVRYFIIMGTIKTFDL